IPRTSDAWQPCVRQLIFRESSVERWSFCMRTGDEVFFSILTEDMVRSVRIVTPTWRIVSMQTAHELFVHELTDMLDAEQKLVEALGKQAEESSRPDLQKAFQSHQQQTQKQVERLQQCFDLLDEEAEETECKGIAGIIAEHDTFKEEEEPTEDLMDIFNVGAAAKVESYEIAAYESLINLAQ